MIADLFSQAGALETLGLPDADIRLQAVLPALGDAETLFRALRTETPCPGRRRCWRSRRPLEAACGESFNSVLLNLYRDHRDSVGMHADDEPELGPTPVIASVSLGAEHWRHGLPKQSRPAGERINLTFRQIRSR